MDAATVTQLTSAFDVNGFIGAFATMAPFIVTVVGALIGVSLLKWGIKAIRRKLSGGV